MEQNEATAAEIASLEVRITQIIDDQMREGGIYGSPGATLLERIEELKRGIS